MGDHWLVRLGVFNILASYASGHDNHALARHSRYKGVRSSPSSWPYWSGGAPPPLRDSPPPKVSFERNSHEGVALGIEAGLAPDSKVWGV
ncbi:unnamed protein product [Prunus armeniaca]